MLEGKVGVVFGVANKRSIAWGIVVALSAVQQSNLELRLCSVSVAMTRGGEQVASDFEAAC